MGQDQGSTPTKEVEDAILFLQERIPEEDQIYIRFFTTYSVPLELRKKTILTLSYVIHSLAGLSTTGVENAGGYYPLAVFNKEDAVFIPYQLVPGSTTLWWIDIRNFNWTPEALETVSLQDGYFVEPIVDHRKYGLLRLLSGNAILNAAWFIRHTTDTMLQVDTDRTILYDTLLYAKTAIPQNTTEWRTTWGINLQRARRFGNEAGVLVTKSQEVARHNRELFYYRTELGWMYETYDVKNEEGQRDYVAAFPKNKGLPPKVSDAGELFASNQLHMMVYALRNQDGKIVHDAAVGIARHTKDVLGDARVRVSHSCMECHAAGPIPAENTMRTYIRNQKLKMPDKKDQLKIEATFLSGKFEESIPENQQLYAKALLKINGLTPEENVKYYKEVISWYDTPLDIEQAAFECGVSVEMYKEKMGDTKKIFLTDKIPGRIALLISSKEPIPRRIWETRGKDGIPGLFQQSMIIINGLTKIIETKVLIVTAKETTLYVGDKKVGSAKRGDVLFPTNDTTKGKDGVLWIGIKLEDGKFGWIRASHVAEEFR